MDTSLDIAERWSPRSYRPDRVSGLQIHSIFEAARSAHSCFNEQPWRFLFAQKDAGAPRATLEALLVSPGNDFAKVPWILGVTFAKKTFAKTGAPNRHCGYDLGSATQLMSLRAHSLGLGMRFMAGFDAAAAAKLVPADFEPYSMFVIGVADGTPAPKRSRIDLDQIAFENAWGNPLS